MGFANAKQIVGIAHDAFNEGGSRVVITGPSYRHFMDLILQAIGQEKDFCIKHKPFDNQPGKDVVSCLLGEEFEPALGVFVAAQIGDDKRQAPVEDLGGQPPVEFGLVMNLGVQHFSGANNDIQALFKVFQGLCRAGDIGLIIGVHKADILTFCSTHARFQGMAFSAIWVIPDYRDIFFIFNSFSSKFGSIIGTAVVYDNDFPGAIQGIKIVLRFLEGVPDTFGFVVGG
jgi:hypothetical protein